MRLYSIFWKMSFICLILGLSQGCDFGEYEADTNINQTHNYLMNTGEQTEKEIWNNLQSLKGQEMLDFLKANNIELSESEIKNTLSVSEIAEEDRIHTINGVQIPEKIYRYMNFPCGQKELDLILAFDNNIEVEIPFTKIEYRGGKMFWNDKLMDLDDHKKLENQHKIERNNAIQATKAKRSMIINHIKTAGIIKDNSGFNDFINGYEPLRAKIDACLINDILQTEFLIGINLYTEPADENMASAMLATFVTQSASYTYNGQGTGASIFVAEASGCPPSNYMPNYHLVGSSNTTTHSRRVLSVLNSVSPNSHKICKTGCSIPNANEIADGAFGSNVPPVFVVNLSCNNDTSNYYMENDQSADDLGYNHNITVVKSAGNRGNGDGYVTSPGKGINVITVGNYDDHNNTPTLYQMRSSSSYVDAANTKTPKPDLSAPGCNIEVGTNASGNSWSADSGTSYAAPHVSGMLANKISQWTNPNHATISPQHMKLRAVMAANDYIRAPNSNYYSQDYVGYGGADFYNMYYTSAWTQYTSNTFAQVDASDPYPNNGAIDFEQYIPAGTGYAAVGISWLVNGTWVYNHRNDTYPMGFTYALYVYAPDGSLIMSRTSLYGNSIVIKFQHNTSGTYHFKVTKMTFNSSNNSKFAMAYAYINDVPW